MTPEDLLTEARVVEHPDAGTPGVWPRRRATGPVGAEAGHGRAVGWAAGG